MTDIYDALQRSQQSPDETEQKPAFAPGEVPQGIPERMSTALFDMYQQVLSQVRPNQGITLSFVGQRASSGSSVLSARFAQLIANLVKKRVLYVNVNPSRTGAVIFAEVSAARGLSEFIHGRADLPDCVRRAGQLDVTTLSLGDLEMVAPLLEAEAFEAVMRRLAEDYDLVVFDTPPTDETAEAIALAGKMDGVIMVVEAENTRWQVAAKLRTRIEAQGGHVLGVILNRRKLHVPEFIYQRT